MCQECYAQLRQVDQENGQDFRTHPSPDTPPLMEQLMGQHNYVRQMIQILPTLGTKGQWTMKHGVNVDVDRWVKYGEIYYV